MDSSLARGLFLWVHTRECVNIAKDVTRVAIQNKMTEINRTHCDYAALMSQDLSVRIAIVQQLVGCFCGTAPLIYYFVRPDKMPTFLSGVGKVISFLRLMTEKYQLFSSFYRFYSIGWWLFYSFTTFAYFAWMFGIRWGVFHLSMKFSRVKWKKLANS